MPSSRDSRGSSSDEKESADGSEAGDSASSGRRSASGHSRQDSDRSEEGEKVESGDEAGTSDSGRSKALEDGESDASEHQADDDSEKSDHSSSGDGDETRGEVEWSRFLYAEQDAEEPETSDGGGKSTGRPDSADDIPRSSREKSEPNDPGGGVHDASESAGESEGGREDLSDEENENMSTASEARQESAIVASSAEVAQSDDGDRDTDGGQDDGSSSAVLSPRTSSEISLHSVGSEKSDNSGVLLASKGNDDYQADSASDLTQKAASATKIQRKIRNTQTRARTKRHTQRRHKAATRIQAVERGRQSRRKRKNYTKSATRIQAVERGRKSRRKRKNYTKSAVDARLKRVSQDTCDGMQFSTMGYGSDAECVDRFPTASDGERVGASSTARGSKRQTPRREDGDSLEFVDFRTGYSDLVTETQEEHDAARLIQTKARRKLKERRKIVGSTSSPEAPNEPLPADLESDTAHRNEAISDEAAARRIQRRVRSRKAGRRKRQSQHTNDGVESRASSGEDEPARLIKKRARQHKEHRTGQEMRSSQQAQGETAFSEDGAVGNVRMEEGHQGRRREKRMRDDQGSNRKTPLQDPPASTGRTRNKGTNSFPKTLSQESPTQHGTNPALASPVPSYRQPSGWISPGKVAAVAAKAAAAAVAKAAAVCVKAAEEAADAACAASAAAEAEENAEHHSPARSAFWPTDRDGQGPQKQRCGKLSSPARNAQPYRGHTRGGAGDQQPEMVRRRDLGEGGGDRGRKAEECRFAEEEQKLKKAREQARRHARDRRTRALAKEEESKRELRAVQADLMKAEELREKQAMAERSALEAKRARVLEDMRRRQHRLQRLQAEEGQEHIRGSSSSRTSSGDVLTNGEPKRARAGEGHRLRETFADDDIALSLPPLARGVGEARVRRPRRHVSEFRERILEERRAKKETEVVKRKDLEEKLGRQAEYAAKIRAQAKRALAAEQLRAQKYVDRSTRDRNVQSVDRTPVTIKRPVRDGEWGVFSYAPDRPNVSAKTEGQAGSSSGRPAAGFGSSGRVHHRLGTSQLMGRMRQERARATEASRARAAAAAAGGSKSGGQSGQEIATQRPVPPPQQYSTSTRSAAFTSRQDRSNDTGDRGAGRLGGARLSSRNGPPAADRIHEMYEERLAALERRLAAGEGANRSVVGESDGNRGGNMDTTQGASGVRIQQQSPVPPDSRGGGG